MSSKLKLERKSWYFASESGKTGRTSKRLKIFEELEDKIEECLDRENDRFNLALRTLDCFMFFTLVRCFKFNLIMSIASKNCQCERKTMIVT